MKYKHSDINFALVHLASYFMVSKFKVRITAHAHNGIELIMKEVTLKHFTNLKDYPYLVVLLLYAFIKTFILIFIVLKDCRDFCIRHRTHRSIKMKCGDKCEICCFSCHLAFKCKVCHTSCWDRILEHSTEFNKWLIKIVFGNSKGILEHFAINDDNKYEVYINNVKVERLYIHVIGNVIISFGLLVAIIMYNTYLLNITHICSEDPAIYCFPWVIDTRDPENPSINASEFLHPITNCSQWTNSSVASKIIFRCFHYVFDAKGAVSIAGGLLAFFVLVSKVLISIFLKLCQCDCCCSNCKGWSVVELIVKWIIVILNRGIATVIIVFLVEDRFGVQSQGSPVAELIKDNGVQLLIIINIIEFLLFLPWNTYRSRSQKGNKNHIKLLVVP